MNPQALSFLDEERNFAESFAKTSTRRVKFEKVNDAWLVRFLPVEMGKSRRWYVRMAQHWHNRKPIFCPRGISPDYGGHPDADCPVCSMAAQLNEDHDERVSNVGYRLTANVTYVTWCLVYQIDHGRGDVEECSMADILKPYEFQHYKGSFEQLMNFFRRGFSEKKPLSVLDFDNGCDFWVAKQKKGLAWDRQDAGPCLEADNFEKNLDTIFSRIHEPKIVVPTDKELETFARKAEASAYEQEEQQARGSRGGGGGGRGSQRDGGHDDDGGGTEGGGESEDAGYRRPSRNAARPARAASREEPEEQPPAARRPARPSRSEPAEDPEPSPEEDAEAPVDGDAPGAESEDQVPGAEVPARRATPVSARAPAGSPRTATPARQTARPVSARQAPAPEETGDQEEQPPAPRQSPGVRRPAAASAAASRPASAGGGVSRPARTAAPAQSSVDEEEDPGVAEEQTDQADAAETPLADEGGAEGEQPQATGAMSPLKERMLKRIRGTGAPAAQ